MEAASFLTATLAVLGAGLAIFGALSASLAPIALRSVALVLLAFVGVALFMGALGAGGVGVVVSAVIGLANVIVGVALVVRIQEAYGVLDQGTLDRVEDGAEPQERRND